MKSQAFIAVTSKSFSKNSHLRNKLDNIFPNSKYISTEKNFNKDELKSFLKESEGAIIGLDPIDESILKVCPNLKIIAKFGVGLDNIDFEACEKFSIEVEHTQGVNKLSVAENTLGIFLNLCHHSYFSCHNLKNGLWIKEGGSLLKGKKVGIIGVGNIGKEVIRLLKPFQVEIWANDILNLHSYYEKEKINFKSKEEIFKNCDLISLHLPLTQDTRNIINTQSLNLMKRSCYLINTARGELINQMELKEALINKSIGGAALDVFAVEPMEDLEFLSLTNLFCTPHISGNAQEAVIAMGESSIGHLINFFTETRNSL